MHAPRALRSGRPGTGGARWQVTDVRVDGVSAAENYGAQFRRVTASESFAGLVDRMSEKADAAPGDTRGAVQR